MFVCVVFRGKGFPGSSGRLSSSHPTATYRDTPSRPGSRVTWPSYMRYSRWARASPVANHFWFKGNSAQLAALMSQCIRLAVS